MAHWQLQPPSHSIMTAVLTSSSPELVPAGTTPMEQCHTSIHNKQTGLQWTEASTMGTCQRDPAALVHPVLCPTAFPGCRHPGTPVLELQPEQQHPAKRPEQQLTQDKEQLVMHHQPWVMPTTARRPTATRGRGLDKRRHAVGVHIFSCNKEITIGLLAALVTCGCDRRSVTTLIRLVVRRCRPVPQQIPGAQLPRLHRPTRPLSVSRVPSPANTPWPRSRRRTRAARPLPRPVAPIPPSWPCMCHGPRLRSRGESSTHHVDIKSRQSSTWPPVPRTDGT